MISENDFRKFKQSRKYLYVISWISCGISQSLARYHNIYEDASMINKISDIVRSVSIEEIQAVANKYLNTDQLIMEYLPETNE